MQLVQAKILSLCSIAILSKGFSPLSSVASAFSPTSTSRWLPLHPVRRNHNPSATTTTSSASSSQTFLQSSSDSDSIISSPVSLSYPKISHCDDVNTPPSLAKLQSFILAVKSGSDIRGCFTDHPKMGSIHNVIHASTSASNPRPLTPFTAYCYGAAFAKMVQIRCGKGAATNTQSTSSRRPSSSSSSNILNAFDSWGDEFHYLSSLSQTIIAVGRDPRTSGVRLSDSFVRGIESVDGVSAVYTGLASTPSMFEFCRSDKIDCDGAVMITASHLPEDRNGFKFFTRNGGLTKSDINILAEGAASTVREWHDLGIVPPSSGDEAIICSAWVDFMPHYETCLKNAIVREVPNDDDDDGNNGGLPLKGLTIVLNAGNGAGCFFQNVLKELGADVSHSIHLTPDGTFPEKAGVPNPECLAMMEETTEACISGNADIGIMLDTDADRCGFIIPRMIGEDGSRSNYEALNRNRLIALLSVIFQSSSPGCTIVTDSVTSEGLEKFIHGLGLAHFRYLKGYANVIGKARELTETGRATAEMAIETSGHCAMRENGYLDDGTYTAVKVIGLLARVAAHSDGKTSLLDLISDLEEMDEEKELRMECLDGSLETTQTSFQAFQTMIEEGSDRIDGWEVDTDNLEGIRVRTGDNGGFFMLRVSLHDPVISLQVEGTSEDDVRDGIIMPLLDMMTSDSELSAKLDISSLREY